VDPFVNPYAAEIEARRARLTQPRTPMFSPAEVAQRQAENERQYSLGLLGQLSGDEAAAPVGATIFKQALQARQPRVTDKGQGDQLSGAFRYNPEYLEQRDRDELSEFEKLGAGAEARWVEARQRAAEREAEQRENRALRQTLGALAANNRSSASERFQQQGYTEDGALVVSDRGGANYIVRHGAQGPTYQPYDGMVTPKASFEKSVTTASEARASSARASQLLGEVKSNPSAFGMRPAAVSLVPGQLQGYAAQALGVTPAQLEQRARVVREAAMEINALYGAALSMGEAARAATFLPNASDPPEMILAKLEAARNWADQSFAMQSPGVRGVAERRTPVAPQGASGPAAGAPIDVGSRLAPQPAPGATPGRRNVSVDY
jgi:hypothetical protein